MANSSLVIPAGRAAPASDEEKESRLARADEADIPSSVRRDANLQPADRAAVPGQGSLGLAAALALVRPLLSIVGLMDDLGKPLAPVVITLVISLIWIAAVGLSSVPNPLLTLVFTGLTYGALSIALSGVLSPILDGELEGPLASPFGIGVVAVTSPIRTP
jgi:hypothetical protein